MSALSYLNERILYSTSAIANYVGGLPFDSEGSLVVNFGTTAPSHYTNGIPYSSSGAVAVDIINPVSTHTNGIPIASSGRVAAESDVTTSSYNNSYPMGNGKLALGVNPNSMKLNGVAPSLVHDYANQSYYNSTNGFTAFPFTSVRTTNAMTFDSQGRLVWAPANMFLNSNPVLGSFGGPTNATSVLDTTYSSPTGNPVYKLVAGNGITLNGNDANGGMSANAITTVASYTYAISFYARAGEVTEARVREPTTTGFRATINLLTGVVTTESGTATLTGGMVVTTQDAGAGWWRIASKRTVSGTSQAFNIKVGGTTGDGVSGIYISSCQFEPDDATAPKAFNATSGTAYYGPRFYYNPTTLAVEGVLSETAQTNDIARSNLLSSVTGVTDTAGGTYLGGWQFRRLTGDGAASQHTGLFDSLTPPATTVRRVYALVKNVSATHCQLTVSTAHGPADAYININFSSGTVVFTGAGASAATCIALQDGVYWIGFNYTTIGVPAVGAGAAVAIVSSDAAARLESWTTSAAVDVAFAGNTTLSQMQLPVLTTGVAVTKAGDSLAITAGSWLDTTQGTMYVNYIIGNMIAGSFPPVASLSDGTANNKMQLQIGSAASNFQPAFRCDDAGVLQVNAGTAANINYMSTAKVVQQYKTNDYKGVVNGTGVLLDTVCTFPASANILRLGQASSWIGMVIYRECRYYPDSSASQAQLQTLTT